MFHSVSGLTSSIPSLPDMFRAFPLCSARFRPLPFRSFQVCLCSKLFRYVPFGFSSLSIMFHSETFRSVPTSSEPWPLQFSSGPFGYIPFCFRALTLARCFLTPSIPLELSTSLALALTYIQKTKSRFML